MSSSYHQFLQNKGNKNIRESLAVDNLGVRSHFPVIAQQAMIVAHHQLKNMPEASVCSK